MLITTNSAETISSKIFALVDIMNYLFLFFQQ